MADRALLHLLAIQLKYPLHCVLVEAQQASGRAVAEGRMLLDQLLDRDAELLLHHRWLTIRALVLGPPQDIEPSAQPTDRDLMTLVFNSLPDRVDHFASSFSRDSNFFCAQLQHGLAVTGIPCSPSDVPPP